MPNDPRITPPRPHPGLESARLCTAGLAAIRKNSDAEAEQVNELRYGDGFTLYDERDGWAMGQCARDNYMGYVRSSSLSRARGLPTHRVGNLVTFLFPEPSIKAPPLDRITFLSTVEVVGEEEKFCKLKGGGYIHKAHLVPLLDWREPDVIDVALRFLGVPYLWGGISPLGCDCSGLIQAALQAVGVPAPRDSDMQAEMGKEVDEKHAKRGDIMCFQGHIGFMTDHKQLLHANAYHGKVVQEPLADVVKRGSAITAVRRL